jgi:UDP-N-acetylglucosamine--N-acetylmuramyl-(pentapeptide) pyrophosphoryl-undecaprenol N-acetylglucosamine transferase
MSNSEENVVSHDVNVTQNAWVVIAGGGTAGHVLPALAVAKQLRSDGLPNEAIHFVGSERGIEKRLVPEAGFSLTVLPGRGIERKLSRQNVASAFALVQAVGRAFKILRRQRPAVVFSVGGYASVPCAFSAVVLRIPLILAESNARAGVAIRSVARFAKATAVAFDGTGLPRAELVGNPVREEILALQNQDGVELRTRSRAALGYDSNLPMLAVFGGSLGARRINEAVFAACDTWSDRRMAIHHVIGDRDFDSAQAWLSQWRAKNPNTVLDYRQIKYEDRMDLVYGAADVAVCRAGATSVADLAVAGLPAILIPLPSAAEDHQTANAQAAERDGAVRHVADKDFDTLRLISEVDALLLDSDKREVMRKCQQKRSRPMPRRRWRIFCVATPNVKCRRRAAQRWRRR